MCDASGKKACATEKWLLYIIASVDKSRFITQFFFFFSLLHCCCCVLFFVFVPIRCSGLQSRWGKIVLYGVCMICAELLPIMNIVWALVVSTGTQHANAGCLSFFLALSLSLIQTHERFHYQHVSRERYIHIFRALVMCNGKKWYERYESVAASIFCLIFSGPTWRVLSVRG